MDQLEYSSKKGKLLDDAHDGFFVVFQLANAARKQYDSWQRRDILRLRNECEQWEE
jgi:hypothetical protein